MGYTCTWQGYIYLDVKRFCDMKCVYVQSENKRHHCSGEKQLLPVVSANDSIIIVEHDHYKTAQPYVTANFTLL